MGFLRVYKGLGSIDGQHEIYLGPMWGQCRAHI